MIKIVAVSTCPTGVAHTYMAAESLENAAKDMNIQIKVETQGALGAENILTDEDINNADFVLLAIGKDVNKDRFLGKKIIEVSVGRAVKEPKKVLEETIKAGESSILYLAKKDKERKKEQQVGVYKHLMSGVSFMIPVVVTGGILLALSFMFGINSTTVGDPSYNIIAVALANMGGNAALALMIPVLAAGMAYSIADRAGIAPGLIAGELAKLTGSGFIGGIIGGLLAGYLAAFLVKNVKLPKVLISLKAIIIVPLLSSAIVGFVMIFVIGGPVTVLLNALTYWFTTLGTTNAVILGAIIGGMMAFDMGGPLNKATYAFALGLMASKVYGPMAACMAAGMVPPIGLAIATLLFKKKFNEEEKDAGKAAWVLGASFITEGAIPFAVADPLRVIPSIVAGSAVAGALSMVLGCASRAPHGGIWVMFIPHVITNVTGYIFAIVAGSIVTALIVGCLKKDKVESVVVNNNKTSAI